MNTNEIEKILRSYDTLLFNKEMLGQYKIAETSGVKVNDEDVFMKRLHEAIDGIRRYPKNGEIMYNIVTTLCTRRKNSEEMAEELSIAITTMYMYRRKALGLLAQMMSARSVPMNGEGEAACAGK